MPAQPNRTRRQKEMFFRAGDQGVSNYKVAQAFRPAGFGDCPVATFMQLERFK
jgi:hypothetical protein